MQIADETVSLSININTFRLFFLQNAKNNSITENYLSQLALMCLKTSMI